MPRPLSMDLRERIHSAVESGLSCNAAAKRYAVAPSSVIKLMQAFKATGSLAPKQMGGYNKAILEPHEAVVKALVAATPDATLAELGESLRTKKIKVSRSALARFLARLRLTFEKTLHASEQDRPDVAAARTTLIADQAGLPVPHLVFIDETGIASNLVRRYGRASPPAPPSTAP